MKAFRENEQRRKLNKNAIMQFVSKFNQNKAHIQALEKDIAKRERLAFEQSNIEAPMITEMEEKQEQIRQQKRNVVIESKAANYQRLNEELARREPDRQAELAENQRLMQ